MIDLCHTKRDRKGLQQILQISRHIGVVCKNLLVAQPEVGINISLSDEGDIIKCSVFY
jgi:hypothetical protein